MTGNTEPEERPPQQKPKPQQAPGNKKPLFEEVPGGYYDEMSFYILPDNQGYYDPKGVFFNADGFNAEGGYYDEAGRYWPPRSQRKKAKDIDDDELIKQFEDGLNETDDVHDDFQNKYYR